MCRSENSKGVYCLQYDDEKIVSGLRDNTIKVCHIDYLLNEQDVYFADRQTVSWNLDLLKGVYLSVTEQEVFHKNYPDMYNKLTQFYYSDMGQKIFGKYSCLDWPHWISAVFTV